MQITGYRTLTEKERDYLTIHRLLRKHKISTKSIDESLDNKLLCVKGGIPLGVVDIHLSHLMSFCIACDDSPDYTLRLDQLPEGTTKLLIETK